jgi:hypothetical protein
MHASAHARAGVRSLVALLAAAALVTSACGAASDRVAYDEVIATMSMEKAKRFFDQYPWSPYRDRLVDELVGACRREGTADCYRLILASIPRDHARYGEIVVEHERRVAAGAPTR